MTEQTPLPAFDLLLRRSLLAVAGDIFDSQAIMDSADLALAVGNSQAARQLYMLSFLFRGFSPEECRRQDEIARRTDLWDGEEIERTSAGEPERRFSVDIALADLTALISLEDLPQLPQTGDLEALGLGPVTVADEPLCNIPETCARLIAALRTEGGAGIAQLDVLLTDLHDLVTTAPIVDLREHVASDMADVVEMLVLRGLQIFLPVNYPLAYAPTGSAALLHAVARLNPAGLGSYFSNVSRLLRKSDDLPGMVRLAVSIADPDMAEEQLDRWSVLLSLKVDRHVQLDLVDAFADLNDLRPIWLMLAAAARRLRVRDDRDLLWRIRDAGLDCNDLALAVTAQELVVTLANNTTEWVNLGDVRATMGDAAGAEAAYARCLADVNPDRKVLKRLEALRTGDFLAFALIGGIGTSPVRQLHRLARWGAVPAKLQGAHEAVEPIDA